MGEGASALIKRASYAAGIPHVDQDELLRDYLAAYFLNPVQDSVLYDGVAPTLARLADLGVPMGICTNKPESIARRVLGALDIAPFFPAVVGGDRIATRKPDPNHLFLVLDEMGVDHTAGLYVGDLSIDYQSAAAAAVTFLVVPWAPYSTPGRRLGRFEDLTEIIDQ